MPRLYKTMRPQAKYERSLALLDRAKDMRPDIPTKSGIMVGAGESIDEVYQAIQDLAAQRTDILTVGQYLQPSPKHVAVEKFYHPDEFLALKTYALSLGFHHVESGPLVRSSYHAADQVTHI
ncbi:MAG: hypothetical protein ACO36I_20210 [Candidatus Latescibacterota bacterium]